MKRLFAVLMIFTVFSMTLSGCQMIGIGTHTEEEPTYTYTSETNYDTIRFDPIVVKVEKNYLEKSDRNYTAASVESAVRVALAYLNGREAKAGELILLNGAGSTMVYEGKAEIYYAQNRDLPYTSIVTQLMTGVDGVPDWLREGLGAYVADINKESFFTTWGHMIECLNTYDARQKAQQEESSETYEAPYYDLDTLASILYQNNAYIDAMDMGDLSASIASIGYAQEAYNYRGAYCIYAGSFVKYLEKTYGREIVLSLYEGEDFQTATGTSFESALESWKETLA